MSYENQKPIYRFGEDFVALLADCVRAGYARADELSITKQEARHVIKTTISILARGQGITGQKLARNIRK